MPRNLSDTRELSREESIPPHSDPYAPASSPAERLLDALCRAPMNEGSAAVAKFMIESLAVILPGNALGLCQPDHDPATAILASSSHLAPQGSCLFSDCPFERTLPVDDGCGTLLHCAGAESDLGQDDSHLVRILSLAAEAIGSSIKTARLIENARRETLALQQLQASMVQTEKLASLGEISAGVVHELSNPLTSIATYSDYLLRKAKRTNADPDDVERLRRIGESADRILDFARALVSYARPSQEKPAPVDLRDVIERSLLFCEHVVREHHVSVSLEIEAPLPQVRGLAGQLIQVFINLITNACQAMAPNGGTLWVRARVAESKESVCVALQDTGPGIETEHLPHIFEPFYTTKAQGKGTGLGLSIVRYIVVGHGGEVSAESAAQGAVFTVKLPLLSSENDPSLEGLEG